MNIGQKIKNLRIEKMMTQSELAGTAITRNMLSQIENGGANPSISTVSYLAKKLGVPAGYLLSEGDEEFVYVKTAAMRNIKRAYADKSFELCRDMCESSFEEYDDELELILTDCCIGQAEECIKNGQLHIASELLDEALIHSEKTVYTTLVQRNRILAMFKLLKEISPALDSNEIDTDIPDGLTSPFFFDDVFCKYITLLLNMERNTDIISYITVDDLSENSCDKLFVSHLKARKCMMQGDYRHAISILNELIDGETVPPRLLLYFACMDMEMCCKYINDYKGAYEFSGNKMDILERMLAER
jgi:transcriptional regulator with XRE-family HTH domain